MIDGVTGPDVMSAAFPIGGFESYLENLRIGRVLRAARRDATTSTERENAQKDLRAHFGVVRRQRLSSAWQHLQRRLHTPYGFRERLVDFWADHFTAYSRRGEMRAATAAFVEDAIRPHVARRFDEMLVVSVTHPVMLEYLNQKTSTGPTSPAALRSEGKLGLNENLAREILELHTLGVDGPYTQTDVRQLAELLTGLGFTPGDGFLFRKPRAEPGAETVLGRSYGGAEGNFDDIKSALRDLAQHPATYRHLAQKLAVHFVSDQPDPDLVAHLTEAFNAGGGALVPVYRALLSHPRAWDPTLQNVKPPADFVVSALRALAIPETALALGDVNGIRRLVINPLRIMGQRWQRPPGPDGWPEDDSAWITPQGLSTRMAWAMETPARLIAGLPDPRQFVDDALDSYASDAVRFAAATAESKPEAIGLVLSSPAFQRR